MVWIRDWYHAIDRAWLDDRIIIHGHSPLKKEVIGWFHQQMEKMQVLGIDNGCFNYQKEGLGNLCCFDMTNRELHFEPNADF